MRIAYFLMMHQITELFPRLWRAIYDPGCVYRVHVDRKADAAVEAAVQEFLAPYPNARTMERHNCVLAGWSMVKIELKAIEHLLQDSADWDFLINLSAACFPLRTQAEIRAGLDQHPGANFMDVRDARQWASVKHRASHWAVEIKLPFYARVLLLHGVPRTFVPGYTPYGGSAWHILSRRFCEYVVHSPEPDPLKRFFRHGMAPEETFFQTVLMNSPFADTLVNYNYREILWPPSPRRALGPAIIWFLTARGPHSPRTLRIEHLEHLLASAAFFARKFDLAVDREIIAALEAHLQSRAGQPARRAAHR